MESLFHGRSRQQERQSISRWGGVILPNKRA
jgi:hypothetical protein